MSKCVPLAWAMPCQRHHDRFVFLGLHEDFQKTLVSRLLGQIAERVGHAATVNFRSPVASNAPPALPGTRVAFAALVLAATKASVTGPFARS